MTTPYELSTEQVEAFQAWLEPWEVCPWCDSGDSPRSNDGLGRGRIPHEANCLFADIAEELTA